MSYPFANENHHGWDPYHLGAYDWDPFFEEPAVPNGPYGMSSGHGQVGYDPAGYGYGQFDGAGVSNPGSTGPSGISGGSYGYGSTPYEDPPNSGTADNEGYTGWGNSLWIVIILLLLIGGGYYLYKNGYFG